jgi:eukaryotic-like serine/threonine-protein kinase
VARPRAAGTGRLRRAAGAALLLAAVMPAAVASDSVGGRTRAVPGSYTDRTGRITVAVPDGWQGREAVWWRQAEFGGGPAPGLLITPAPRRWRSDPAVPGAFVGLPGGIAAGTTPAEFVADQGRGRCTAAPLRRTRQAGIEWWVARYTCPTGKAEIVEAAGVASGVPAADPGLVYAQIAVPAGGGPGFVDRVLAGVRVRPKRSA